MASNFKPAGGIITMARGFVTPKKILLSQNSRQFPTGSALWINKVSGRYQAEPFLLTVANSGTDVSSSTSVASTYNTAAAAQTAAAALFLGIANAMRIPQQGATFGQYGSAGGSTGAVMDASQPFIEYYDEGEAWFPVGPTLSGTGVLTSAIDPATLLCMDGFQNNNTGGTNGFNDPAGASQSADTNYYLYNNCVTTTATAADAIAVVVERAEIGASQILAKFRSFVFTQGLG